MLCVQTVNKLAVTFQPVNKISLCLHSDRYCLEVGVISVCFLLGDEQPGYDLQGSPVRRGSYPSIVVPTGTKQGVQSPLERRPSSISTDRPQMESRPYEFLLQSCLGEVHGQRSLVSYSPWDHRVGCSLLLLLLSHFSCVQLFATL